MAPSKVCLKLLIDTKGLKVLFAEAGKDFVDFLFYLLSLPVGTVVKHFKRENMVGSLSNLYESLENLSDAYMQPNQNKDSVLNPRTSLHDTQIPLLLFEHESSTQKFYICLSCHCYVADVQNLPCPSCKTKMIKACSYVSPSSAKSTVPNGGGFVKEVVTYMITDNLEVSPMSTISFLTSLNKFKVKDVGQLEERVVDVSVDEGLKLLKASLECKTVLTRVFLGN